MGREIKRVPANFDWPMGQIWKGYVCPYQPLGKCPDCKGSGLSPEVKKICDSFYDSGHYSYPSPNRWCDKITDEEVRLLVDKGRLTEFTERIVKTGPGPGDWKRDRILNEDGTPFYPSAEELNRLCRDQVLLHDGINRWILIEHRARKAGVWVSDEGEEIWCCDQCNGDGNIWASEEVRIQHENFYADERADHKIGQVWFEPPVGKWWQVWETVSEGSPVSPAFETADELIDWLADGGDLWNRNRRRPAPSRESCERFVKEYGWVPTAISGPGGFSTGIESA